MMSTSADFEKIKTEALAYSKNKNYDLSLQQWEKVIKLRPDYIPGYVSAINILLLQKKITAAESLCNEGIEKCKMPDVNLLLCSANIKREQKKFSEAFKIWEEIRQLYPESLPGYARAARLHMSLKEYDRGMKLCEAALKKCQLPEITYSIMAQIKTAEKDYSKALKLCEEIRKIKPLLDEGYRRAALIYIEIGKYDMADRMCEEAIKNNAISIYLYRAYILSTKNKKLPEYTKLRELYERQLMLCNAFPENFLEMVTLANTCHALKKYIPSLNLIENYILSSIFEKYKAGKIAKTSATDIMPKICFYSDNLIHFKFWVPVIKYICPSLIDVVIGKKGNNDSELIEKYDIENYNILYGFEHTKNYDYIALDHGYLSQKKFGELHAKFIILPLNIALSPSLQIIKKSSLCISMASTEYNQDEILAIPKMNEKNKKLLSDIDIQARCEITHTGPYHVGTFIRYTDEKFIYRRMLQKKYNYKFYPDKPFVAIYEDDRSDLGQFINCANYLCEYANIIVIPLAGADFTYKDKLNTKINIYTDKTSIPELPIYSVDFILAGFCSNSLFTAMMLGLCAIPYYSQSVHIGNIEKTYKDILKSTNTTEKVRVKALNQIRLYDLQDLKAIKKAILKNEFSEWYYSKLPQLQKDIFGDYLLEEAAHQTADHIMRFAIKHTVGENCKAIYLHEQFFV